MSRKGCNKVEYDSDSGDSQSDCESLASGIDDHDQDQRFDNLLNCFGFREIINEDVDDIELTEGEALLMDFLRKTESLSVIKEVLQQNGELAKQLCENCHICSGFSGLPKHRQSVNAIGVAPTETVLAHPSNTA